MLYPAGVGEPSKAFLCFSSKSSEQGHLNMWSDLCVHKIPVAAGVEDGLEGRDRWQED